MISERGWEPVCRMTSESRETWLKLGRFGGVKSWRVSAS
jgi:hypothetical protein